MPRQFKLISLCLAFSLGLVACAAPVVAPTSTPIPPTATLLPPTATSVPALVVIDGLGREVNLSAPATRIVSLAASNTEIMFAIGGGRKLVGRDDFSDYPPEAAQVASIGSLYPKVNAETIVALKPDLVLAAGITSPDDVNMLAGLGLNVYAAKKAITLDDIFNDILNIGQLTGQAQPAVTLVSKLKNRVQNVTVKVNEASAKPVVFYEIDASEPAKPWTSGPGSFVDLLITLSGGTNAGAKGSDYFQISLEELVTQNPDLIVLGSATYGGQTPETVAAREGWQTLKAVTNSAVYTFDDNLISRPGPRIVDGLEALAKLIHPELFK